MGPRVGLDGGKSRPTGIRSPDRPARSQSLYRLSYPAHTDQYVLNSKRLLHEAFGKEVVIIVARKNKAFAANAQVYWKLTNTSILLFTRI